MATAIYLSEDFDSLEPYFSGDIVDQANQLIADKVSLAWDILQASSQPLTTTVNASGTQLTTEYAANSLAQWSGGARVVVNGSSLSTDSADQDFSITSIDFILTSSDTPNDWENPLASVSLGLSIDVNAGRATALTLSSFEANAGDMHVAFIGPISLDETAQTVNMPDARFEISFDSDPTEAVVRSEIYFEGNLSYDGVAESVVGTFSDFGFKNDAGHYFYSTGLNVSTTEIENLPDGASSTDLLRAVFEGPDDTIYSATNISLPEGFENASVLGDADTDITGNTQDNVITGNVANNVIDGGAGVDTFVTQNVRADWSGRLNQDGSITLNATTGGYSSDTLIGIENVTFDDGTFAVSSLIESAEVFYQTDASEFFDLTFDRADYDGFVKSPSLIELGREGQVALSDNGRYTAQGLSDRIEVRDIENGVVQSFDLMGARPYGNYAPFAISDDGNTIFFYAWNDLNPSGIGYGGLYRYDTASGVSTRVDVDANGNTVTYQGWSMMSADEADISSDGRYVVFSMRDTVAPNDFNSGQKTNIFVKDLETGVLQKVDTENINQYSRSPQISDDGRYVFFASYAELTLRDANDGWTNEDDLFMFDRQTNITTRVNEYESGQRIDHTAQFDISADGSQLVFISYSGLTEGDWDGMRDVYVKDITEGSVHLVSESVGWSDAYDPHISPDGDYVSYQYWRSSDSRYVTEVRQLSSGDVFTVPGLGLLTTNGNDSEYLYSLADGRGLIWTWRDYPGMNQDWDGDYVVFDYAEVAATSILTVDGQALPGGFEYDSETGVLSVNDQLQQGTYYLTRETVFEYSSNVVRESFAVEVGPYQNDAPTLRDSLPEYAFIEGAEVEIKLPNALFYDPDLGDYLTLTVGELPSWLSFEAAANGISARLLGIAPIDSSTSEQISLTATDSFGTQTTAYLSVNVIDLPENEGASVYISDDQLVLEPYFSGDIVDQANQLIADKVSLAWDILQANTQPLVTTVNASGTQLTTEYAANSLAQWSGGARVVVNGSSLSTDSADQDFSITSIDFILTSSDRPNDWENPLASVSLGLSIDVNAGRATALTLSSFEANAGEMHVAFIGPISLDETAQTVNMPDARFEISFDSDPTEAVVRSEIYFEGNLSYDGATDSVVGTFSDFGFKNDAGHYFYSTGLNVSTTEIENLPDGASSTDLLRAVFEGSNDTIYSTVDGELPEGFENAEALGEADVDIVANSQDNRITGNAGINFVDGGAGIDTFVTQGVRADWSGRLNQDGSITLSAAGYSDDTLANTEQIVFNQGGSFAAEDLISDAQLKFVVAPNADFNTSLPEIYIGDGTTDINFLKTNDQLWAMDDRVQSVVSSSGSIYSARWVNNPKVPSDWLYLDTGSGVNYHPPGQNTTWWIPKDPANTDYQNYLAWLDQGNTAPYSQVIEVTRVFPDGRIDEGFGINGQLLLTPQVGMRNWYASHAPGITENVSGKIIVSSAMSGDLSFAAQSIYVIEPDGSAVVVDRLADGLNWPTDISIRGSHYVLSDTDGGYFVVGEGDGFLRNADWSDFDVVVAKFTADGQFDTTYGSDTSLRFSTPGVSYADFGSWDAVLGAANSVNGEVYVLTRCWDFQGPTYQDRVGVVKFDDVGMRDTSFGGSGFLSIPAPDDQPWFPTPLGICVDKNGYVLVAYYSRLYQNNGGNGTEITVARYNQSGLPDTSFGIDGDGLAKIWVSNDTSYAQTGAQLLTIDSQGRPILAFNRENETEVLRMSSDGTAYTELTNPQALLSFPGPEDPTLDLALGSHDRPNWVQVDAFDNIYVGVTDSYYNENSVWQTSYSVSKFNETGLDASFDNIGEPTYSLLLADGSPLPDWVSFDPTSRTLDLSPSYSQSGLELFKLSVSGIDGFEKSSYFGVEVPSATPQPQLELTTDPTTGHMSVKAGWVGGAFSSSFEIFADGAELIEARISQDLIGAGGWTAAYTDNGIAGTSVQAKFTAVGSDVAAPYGGAGEEITFVLKPTGLLESVVVELNGIRFTDAADTRVEYGDQSLAPVLVRTDVSV
uniref:putative Ig domain-containing protein n=1 Tax=Shewanella sp. TaxID=50422 RepID=UPI004048E78D